MKIQSLVIGIGLAWLSHVCAAPITYDFQSLSAGSHPFLTLTVNGVTAYFSGGGGMIDVDPDTGIHALHTIDYHSQMGIEFSAAVSQVIIGLDAKIPSTNNFLQTRAYYGADSQLHNMPVLSSSGLTLSFTVPPDYPAVMGLLVDGNAGAGYSMDYVSITLIPEPSTASLLILATALVLTVRGRYPRFGPASSTSRTR